jgi:hypothetical protein
MPKYQPCPGNAPGPFYVVAGGCIGCRDDFGFDDALWEQAEFMDLRGEPDRRDHCRFHRQPETPQEVQLACVVVRRCSVQAIRYAGNDKTILDRISEPEACDVMPIIRDDYCI